MWPLDWCRRRWRCCCVLPVKSQSWSRRRILYLVICATVLFNLHLLTRLTSGDNDTRSAWTLVNDDSDTKSSIGMPPNGHANISMDSSSFPPGTPLKTILKTIAMKRLACLQNAPPPQPLRQCAPSTTPKTTQVASSKGAGPFCTDTVRLKQPVPDYVKLGHIKPNIKLAIGVATVSRPDSSYLLDTLKSLISNSTTEERVNTAILVFLADIDNSAAKDTVASKIQETFPAAVDAGDVVVIQAPGSFYPPLTGLKRNFNDKPDRVYWRAKQCIDFSFLFSFASNISEYYLNLEDDVITKPGYVTSIMDAVTAADGRFFQMDFCQLGFIGKLFESKNLLHMAAFHYYFYEEMPVDWLQPIYNRLASRDFGAPVSHYPSLFQHMGKLSSLKGKKQTAKDAFFDSHRKFSYTPTQGFMFTNIPHPSSHPPSMAGSNAGYFWSKATPKKGDWFLYVYPKGLIVDYLLIAFGNPQHPNDTIGSAELSYSSEVATVGRKTATCRDWKSIGKFGLYEQDGKYGAVGKNLTDIGDIKCLKFVVLKPRGNNWMLISEFHVIPPNTYSLITENKVSKHVILSHHVRNKFETYQQDMVEAEKRVQR